MKLTESFAQSEFEHSNYAIRHGIDNRVPAHLQENLERLAHVLQHIRDYLGEPVVISSGYRCQELNKAVKGATTSHHRFAAAADWTCPGFGTPLECALAIEPHCDLWGVKQLIHEFGGWVHISTMPVAIPNQIITIDSQGTRVGLHPAR
jgi:zinc D-Ala-D-Ala carboxypeptidase